MLEDRVQLRLCGFQLQYSSPPLPCHPAGSPPACPGLSWATSPKSDIRDAARDKGKHQAAGMDSGSCWQTIHVGSSVTVLWCMLENWLIIQLAMRKHRGTFRLPLQVFCQASAAHFVVIVKSLMHWFRSLPTLQLLLIELCLTESYWLWL